MAETLEARIKRHEGYKPIPYKCSRGTWTIGYGHKMVGSEREKFKDGITQEHADALFAQDFSDAKHRAIVAAPTFTRIDEARQGVIIEMIYQLGLAGTLGFRRMFAALDRGNYVQAAREMRDSDWFKQTPQRCDELADIMEGAPLTVKPITTQPGATA